MIDKIYLVLNDQRLTLCCMKNFVTLSLLVIFSLFHFWADCSQVHCNSVFQETRIELGYTNGTFISIAKDYAEVGLFIPLSLTIWGAWTS